MARKNLLVQSYLLVTLGTILLGLVIYGSVELIKLDRSETAQSKLDAYDKNSVATVVQLMESDTIIIFNYNNHNCTLMQKGVFVRIGDRLTIWYNSKGACSRNQFIAETSSDWIVALIFLVIFGSIGSLVVCCRSTHLRWRSQFNTQEEENSTKHGEKQ
jgi:hypothetical protein